MSGSFDAEAGSCQTSCVGLDWCLVRTPRTILAFGVAGVERPLDTADAVPVKPRLWTRAASMVPEAGEA